MHCRRILFTKLNRYDTSGNKVIKSSLYLPRAYCHMCFYKGVTVPQKSDTNVNIMRGDGIQPLVIKQGAWNTNAGAFACTKNGILNVSVFVSGNLQYTCSFRINYIHFLAIDISFYHTIKAPDR